MHGRACVVSRRGAAGGVEPSFPTAQSGSGTPGLTGADQER